MDRLIINLLGRKRSGKETAYKLMSSLLEQPMEFQFATPLKKFCIEALGLTYEQCYGSDSCRESPSSFKWDDVEEEIKDLFQPTHPFLTARQVLQVVGTNLLRNKFYKRVWAEAAVRTAITSRALICIFTDGRFLNEIESVNDAKRISPDPGRCSFKKTLNIRLYRETGLKDAHESETALDLYDICPNQRSIRPEHYVALTSNGYKQITPRLWKSEKTINVFDYLIDNNHSVSNLQETILTLFDIEHMFMEKSPS